MTLVFHNGRLLFSGGLLAMSSACCCGGCCTRLEAYAALSADISCGACTETITLTGSLSGGWTGTSSCESIMTVTFNCLGDDSPGVGLYSIEVYMESSAPCVFTVTDQQTAACSPLDVTFQLTNTDALCSCGPTITIRVYPP